MDTWSFRDLGYCSPILLRVSEHLVDNKYRLTSTLKGVPDTFGHDTYKSTRYLQVYKIAVY